VIVVFTDFGPGPYTGQMLAALAREAPGEPAIELMSDAPRFGPRPAAALGLAIGDTLTVVTGR
jgi:hypothetical protein